MAEVKKTKTKSTKKSSKILSNNNLISNEELLDQILTKKRNKIQKSIAPRRNKKSNVVTKKELKKIEMSSDEIYENIKKKKEISKQKKLKKNSIDINNQTTNDFTKVQTKADVVRDDLIITREIRFDDLSSDLKNKKTLKELKEAIEKFDKLDDSVDNADKLIDDIDLLPSVKYSNYRLRRLLIVLGVILSIIIITSFVIFSFSFVGSIIENVKENKIEDNRLLEEQKRKEAEEREALKKYNECLSRKTTDADMTEVILKKSQSLTQYLKDNYSASVVYEDLNFGYKFSYKEDKVFYAASTIKSLDALYIYQKASEGIIDLEDTVTYTSRFKVSYSSGVSKHKLGSKISLRKLVSYAILYSDNSAHQMLISYIGKKNLREFGISLGAKNTLSGGDNFGNISAKDGLIYMKEINKFIENNGELGEELKSYFVDSYYKDLSINNLVVANKYGLYKNYYHNMGIIYDESPYVVVIMTTEGYDKKDKIVNNISKKIYELHDLYKTNRQDVCHIEVYGNEKSTSS